MMKSGLYPDSTGLKERNLGSLFLFTPNFTLQEMSAEWSAFSTAKWYAVGQWSMLLTVFLKRLREKSFRGDSLRYRY